MNLDPQQFKLLKPLTWKEVFDIWHDNEAPNPAWAEHYTKKGFSSWEEWRNATHASINGGERDWYLHELTNPLRTIPTFRGGPFHSWQEEYYEGQESPEFQNLVKHPGLQSHEGLADLIKKFPYKTTICGLLAAGDVYIIEGMHRCCAVALAAERGTRLNATVRLTLAEYPEEALPQLGSKGKHT